MTLDTYLQTVHQTHLSRCSGNAAQSKRLCLEGIKLLNKLSKEEPKDIIQTLSKYSLQLYDDLTNNTQTFTEKLWWINSKVRDEFYFPEICFGPTLTSLNEVFTLKEPYQDPYTFKELPDLEIDFVAVDINDWSLKPTDLKHLYQDVLENCSFVSSFLSIVKTLNDFPISLISPNTNNSKYRVRFHFNGTQRLVTIDNKLPLIRNNPNRNLILKSSLNDDLLWPALIEKAFLKIMGNDYKFEGSNMSIDTFLLTGWIPEVVTINNFKLPDDFGTLWSLYKCGHLLLGIGTGNFTKQLSITLNLIPEHDYTIHSFDPTTGKIVLKNPWIENNQADKRFLTVTDLNYFKYLYVNWNHEKFFKHFLRNSFIYSGGYEMFHQYPQFTFRNNKDTSQEVWALLETHFPFKADQTINLMAYETSGDKVLTPNQYICLNPGEAHTSNRMKLVKLKLQPNKSYTVVAFSSISCNFTLVVYNNFSKDFPITKAKLLYESSKQLSGNWESGGNWSLSTFIENPQYLLQVTDPIELLTCLYTKSKTNLVNFHLFHCDKLDKDFKLRNFDKSKLLFNENYNEGHQCVKTELQPGLYKLIISTYNQTDDEFSILLNHSGLEETVKISKISNNLGLFKKTYTHDWMGNNRFKMIFQVDNHNAKFSFHLKHFNNYPQKFELVSDYRPAIRGSIFNAATSKPVQVNEIWNDSLYGVFVDAIIEDLGRYVLLVERLEIGVGTCVVDIGSSHRFVM